MLDLTSDEEKKMYDFIDNTELNAKINWAEHRNAFYTNEELISNEFYNKRLIILNRLINAFKIEIENNLCKSGIDKISFLKRHLKKATEYKNQWANISNKFSDKDLDSDSKKPYLMHNLVSLMTVVEFLEENLKEYNTQQKSKEKETSKILVNSYFNLLVNIDTESCFNVLKGNFIDENTTKRTFNSLFNPKGIVEKISWIGSLPELSRFVFLLHSDYADYGHKSVCSDDKNKYEIASNCFTHNGKRIDATKLAKNNRAVENIERSNLLLRALKHLQRPMPTTSK